MTTNRNERSNDDSLPTTKKGPHGDNDLRREPLFSGFDEDDEEGFEEPDRDTDYSSGYGDDSVEDDDPDGRFIDEDEGDLFAAPDTGARLQTNSDWDEAEPAENPEVDEPEQWPEEEDYADDEELAGQGWPLGLIAVAILALVLLAVGGYGVIQQRSATQEEIRQLRAELATSASPVDVSATRAALQQLQDDNAALTKSADALAMENRSLSDTVAGLEAQLEAQQAVLKKNSASAATSKPATTPKPTKPAPTPKPQPVKSTAVAATATGSWFVNFGSYALRDMAQTWAARLHPKTGRVIIAPSTKDGKSIYRVRVVDLVSKDSAREVARALETEMGVSSLWVGSE